MDNRKEWEKWEWEKWNSDNKNKRISKAKKGINLQTCTDQEVQEYADGRFCDLKECEDVLLDHDFWCLFYEAFHNDVRFTIDDFNRLGRRYLQKARTFLRGHGVRIAQNHKGLSLAQTLINCLEEEEQGTWSEDDIRDARPDLEQGPATSVLVSIQGHERIYQPLAFKAGSLSG
jgi:hypothetical protein